VATGPTSGAGTVADPASRRLCLRRRTAWTAPHRHGLIVAASDPAVALTRSAPSPGCPILGQGWIVTTV
jgi:hypothetical protein